MKGIRYRTIQIQGGEGSYVDSEEGYESSSIAVISGPGLLAISIVNMITEQSLTQGGEYASFNQSDSPAILLSKVNGKIRYTKYNPSVLPDEFNVIFISPRYIG